MVFGGNPSDLVTLFEDHMNMEEEARKSGNGKVWTWEQDKAFENALVMYSEDCSDRWERIAGDVDGKDVGDVKEHYGLLEEDIDAIEGGRVPIPSYGDGGDDMGENLRNGKTGKGLQERRKGTAWSEEEHRLFLLGLKKYGKGDWRSISRHFVISRSATQVASHAQKYFMRLESGTKDKRRTSIHDITTVNEEDDQGPITGQLDQPSSGSLPIPPNCLNTMQESHPRLKSGNKKRNTSSHT